MNIIDYIDWRGDLEFSRDPFNEIDALIFTWLSYYEYEKIAETDINLVEGRTLKEIAETHKNQFGNFKEINMTTTVIPKDSATYLLYKVSQSVRFSQVKLLSCCFVFDPINSIQFFASTFCIDEDTAIISYRGTDTSIAGWKEDCFLAFEDNLIGQNLATTYFNNSPKFNNYYLCGHSKGGNYALWTILNCDEKKIKNIKHLYNFDGPGFRDKKFNTERYQKVKNLITTILPESSIIGVLLEHIENYKTIKSNMFGIFQHNTMMWNVCSTKFIYTENGLSFSSEFVDKNFANFIETMNFNQRKEIVEVLFNILESSGVVYLTDFSKDTIKKVFKMLKSIKGLDKKQRAIIYAFLINIAKSTAKTTANISNDKMKIIKSLPKKTINSLFNK